MTKSNTCRVALALLVACGVLVGVCQLSMSRLAATGQKIEVCTRTGSKRILNKKAWSRIWELSELHPSVIEKQLTASRPDMVVVHDWVTTDANYQLLGGLNVDEVHRRPKILDLRPYPLEEDLDDIISPQMASAIYDADEQQRSILIGQVRIGARAPKPAQQVVPPNGP